MLPQLLLTTLALLPISQAETVLGAYIFHRHGDRTAKSWPPANLTDLGYSQVYSSGDYYRNRWIAANATSPIYGMSSDVVLNSQLAVTAPADTVLQNSAAGFAQALYPPVGAELGSQMLRNGSTVSSPMNGFQLIPIGLTTTSANSEDSAWLQSTTGCGAATISSNEYFTSPAYNSLLDSTRGFYTSLSPVINTTFNSTSTSYKNAYTSTFTMSSFLCTTNR